MKLTLPLTAALLLVIPAFSHVPPPGPPPMTGGVQKSDGKQDEKRKPYQALSDDQIALVQRIATAETQKYETGKPAKQEFDPANKWIAAYTAVLTVVTGILAFLTWRSVKLTEKSLHAIEGAFVYVLQISPYMAGDNPIGITCTLRNCGRSAAIRTTVTAQVFRESRILGSPSPCAIPNVLENQTGIGYSHHIRSDIYGAVPTEGIKSCTVRVLVDYVDMLGAHSTQTSEWSLNPFDGVWLPISVTESAPDSNKVKKILRLLARR